MFTKRIVGLFKLALFFFFRGQHTFAVNEYKVTSSRIKDSCDLQSKHFVRQQERSSSFSGCADAHVELWLRNLSDTVQIIDIGANKGYWSAQKLFELFPNSPLTPSVVYQHWKKYMPERGGLRPCGSCDDCKETWQMLRPSLSNRVRLVLVEALPSNAIILRKLFRGVRNHVRVHNLAVTSSSGFVKFQDAGTGRETNSIFPTGTLRSKYPLRTVRSMTLDDLCGYLYRNDVPISFLKIDTEGYDALILFSGSTCLHRVERLEFEYHGVGPWAKMKLSDTLSYLHTYGFICYFLGSNMSLNLSSCWRRELELHKWSNLFCHK